MLTTSYRKMFKILQRHAINKFILPDLGEKIKEATIKKWHVHEGDSVSEYDTLVDVATDKLFTEISSPFQGKIHKIMYQEEESCNVGDVLLEIETFDQKGSEISNQKETHQVDTESSKNTSYIEKKEEILKQKGKVFASPTVRHLAKSLNIDLTQVRGNDKNGLIKKEDVLAYLEEIKNKSKVESKDTNRKEIKNEEKKQVKNELTPGLFSQHNMTLFEKGMVKSMNYSASVPFLNLMEEFNVSKLIKLRNEFNSDLNLKISIFAFIVKTFSLALLDCPKVNSTYYPEKEEFKYTINHFHNISIAINSKNGLAAPNIKNVQNMSIQEIDTEIKNLIEVASLGKLTQDNLEGGTIGLSNIGSLGGIFATPLAIPGQTCIVATGRVRKTPYWNGNQFEPIDCLPVSFAADHRILDGATIAHFSMVWKKYIENPSILFSKMR